MMAMDTTQTMDLTQAMQTLKWLDEERLKDKATIATLQEQAQGQEKKLAQQAAQIQELQATLAGVQGVLSKVTAFERMVSEYREELILQMDQRQETLRKERAEATRLRQIEYEALTTNLSRLEKDLRVLPQYDEQLNTLRAENQRLSEVLQRTRVEIKELGKSADEPVKAVAYLEEQRRADNRRIVDLEHDTAELHKRIEAMAPKLPLLEETLGKQKARIQEAIQETKKYEKPIEELRVSDFQREQKMKQYLDQAEQVAQEMKRIREQTQGFMEQRQEVKRELAKLEPFQARLEKRQNEVVEMQRVSENRIRRQWEEWQDGQDKQQKKRAIVTEERWRQQGEVNEAHKKWLETLQSSAKLHENQLDTLWEARRADAMRGLKDVQDDYEAVTSQVDEQLAVLRGEQ